MLTLIARSHPENWLHVFLWLSFIYATLPLVRPVCEYLRMTLPFSLFINAIMVTTMSIAVTMIYRKTPFRKLSSYLILGLTIMSYLILLWIIKIPEEKIHFLEYGILAVLIERALRIEKKVFLTYVLTVLFTSFFGLVDEVIQHYLPERYFGWGDVLFNALGGILGVVLVFIAQRERAKGNSVL